MYTDIALQYVTGVYSSANGNKTTGFPLDLLSEAEKKCMAADTNHCD